MDCIDSPDISIRLRALDLVVGMVNTENLASIVGRLMKQLRNSPPAAVEESGQGPSPIEPTADSDDESPGVAIKSVGGGPQELLLPDDYKTDVINRILEMCSSNNYSNLLDFEWYIDILIQLIRNAPVLSPATFAQDTNLGLRGSLGLDVSEKIGDELRSVAVKVKAVRLQATRAAESILISTYHDNSTQLTAGSGAFKPIVWIIGEFASFLETPEDSLTALLYITKGSVPPEGLIVYLQAVPKIFSMISGDDQTPWTPERKTMISLLMARIIHALEPLAVHPDLEVQERAVEFSELLKLAAEAASGQNTSSEDVEQDAPLLLTQAIPSLFTGQELNSVAIGAQRNVPMPLGIDLDQPINVNLNNLLRAVESSTFDEPDEDEFETYYHQKALATPTVLEPAIDRLGPAPEPIQSYQQGGEESYLDPDIVARRRAERMERNKDDPFYIAPNDDASGRSTPLHNILQNSNGTDLDIDAIPIMQLDLGKPGLPSAGSPKKAHISKARQRIQVAADETIVSSGNSSPRNEDSEDGISRPKASRGKSSLLQVDSSHIGAFSLESDSTSGIDFERQQKEEAEMAKAMREVERLRLEMQRANERIQAAQGVSLEGTIVKKKKKKAKPVEGDGEVTVVKKKKAKKPVVIEGEGESSVGAEEVVKLKKKKKKAKVVDEGTVGQES